MWKINNSLEIKSMSKKIVIASACRTAIGSMGGALSTVPAAKLDCHSYKRGFE